MDNTERTPDEPPTIEELQDLLGDIWLYINWYSVTKQLTTRQKELFADAVDAWSARLNAEMEPRPEPVADRWWLPTSTGSSR